MVDGHSGQNGHLAVHHVTKELRQEIAPAQIQRPKMMDCLVLAKIRRFRFVPCFLVQVRKDPIALANSKKKMQRKKILIVYN